MEIITGISPTKYFKYIFPDMETFKIFLTEYTNIDNEDIENIFYYKYLYNMFENSSINYYEVDSFKKHFGLTYENLFEKYKKQREIIDELYRINLNELITTQVFISNLANNPNDMPQNPLDTALDFVSQQTSSKITANKLESYFKSIQMVGDKLITNFLDNFRIHFVTILIPPEAVFIDEDIIGEN